MGRVVIIVPIAIVLADQIGMAASSQSRGVLIAVAALGAYLPSAGILPANIPNLILASGAESLYGISFHYFDYFIATFPTIGVGKLLIIIGTGLLLSSATISQRPKVEPVAPMRADQRRLMFVMIAAVTLWATDAFHGINPAWIGLAAAIVCLLPRVGILDERAFNHEISWAPLIHTAGIIGLGAVVAESGVGEGLGRTLVRIAPFIQGQNFWNYMVLVTLMTTVCLLTTTPGLPAVITPLAGTLAEASGLPLRAVLLVQVLAFSTIIFPYQGAPLVFRVLRGWPPVGHSDPGTTHRDDRLPSNRHSVYIYLVADHRTAALMSSSRRPAINSPRWLLLSALQIPTVPSVSPRPRCFKCATRIVTGLFLRAWGQSWAPIRRNFPTIFSIDVARAREKIGPTKRAILRRGQSE